MEPDLQHILNVSCDFGGDLMARSEKNKCIFVQNLQWESMDQQRVYSQLESVQGNLTTCMLHCIGLKWTTAI